VLHINTYTHAHSHTHIAKLMKQLITKRPPYRQRIWRWTRRRRWLHFRAMVPTYRRRLHPLWSMVPMHHRRLHPLWSMVPMHHRRLHPLWSPMPQHCHWKGCLSTETCIFHGLPRRPCALVLGQPSYFSSWCVAMDAPGPRGETQGLLHQTMHQNFFMLRRHIGCLHHHMLMHILPSMSFISSFELASRNSSDVDNEC
jgi:hypothetical protein